MLRVRAQLTSFVGGPGLNTFYFDELMAPTQTDANECAQAVSNFYTAIASELAQGMIVNVEPTVDNIEQQTGDLLGSFGAVFTPQSITSTGLSQAPAPVMSLIQWSTAGIVAGRRVKGRTFVGPVETTAHQTDGTPAEAHRTAVVGAANTLLTTLTGGHKLCIWARPFAGDPLATPPKPARVGTTHFVTASAVPNKWAVLRSRRD